MECDAGNARWSGESCSQQLLHVGGIIAVDSLVDHEEIELLQIARHIELPFGDDAHAGECCTEPRLQP
eukprot:4300135-Prymnesium_polylepis.1